MKVLKINKKDYVLKFTTKALMNLNAKGITLTSLSSDMENLNLMSYLDTNAKLLDYEIIDKDTVKTKS